MFVEDKKNYVGKKAWLRNDKTIYTIVKCVNKKEPKDYGTTIVLKDETGATKEAVEWDVVLCPDDNITDESERIYRYLNDNFAYVADVSHPSNKIILIDISWGDWKHEHLYTKYLMEFLGYEEIREDVTEEDGSDCYSATHAFLKVA